MEETLVSTIIWVILNECLQRGSLAIFGASKLLEPVEQVRRIAGSTGFRRNWNGSSRQEFGSTLKLVPSKHMYIYIYICIYIYVYIYIHMSPVFLRFRDPKPGFRPPGPHRPSRTLFMVTILMARAIFPMRSKRKSLSRARPGPEAAASRGRSFAVRGFSGIHLAVPQHTGIPQWKPGQWKHGPKPAVCPSCLILSHTHFLTTG